MVLKTGDVGEFGDFFGALTPVRYGTQFISPH